MNSKCLLDVYNLQSLFTFLPVVSNGDVSEATERLK